MKKITSILIAACTFSHAAYAQSPAQNLMPDGSHDMYLGLGVLSRPLYEGAASSKRVAVPVLQMQWSNGLFVAGMSAGLHMSNQYGHEFGPIIMLEPSRTPDGTSNTIQSPAYGQSSVVGPGLEQKYLKQSNRLIGMENIRTRLLAGGFYNFHVSNNLCNTNTLVFGAGNNRQGIRLSSDLRYHFKDIARHHQLIVGVGLNLVNKAYADSYFGVSEIEAGRSINPPFESRAGIKNIHAEAFWNWNLNASWLITSKLSLSQLVGSASKSPLVERKTNVYVSTALAYRF